MSKQKRIKKLVKGHLNSVDAEGAALFSDDAAKIERVKQLQGKSTANPGSNLSDSQLATLLADVDSDSAAHANDAFPFDAREKADANLDGIGDNKEIVNLHVQLLAIEVDAALDAARVVEATTALTATGTHLATLQAEDANGNDDLAAYTTALTAFNTAVTTLETLEGNAAAKVAEATSAHAAMSALPAPAAGIKYTVAATEYTAATVYAGRDAKLAAIVALKDTIDAECGIAGDPARVADANRTSAAATVAPAE